jgi:uncharacterized coiled-coil protein SlyX
LQTNETKKLKAQIKELTEKYNNLLAGHKELSASLAKTLDDLSKAEKALAECTEARKKLQAELDALKNVQSDDRRIKELQKQIDTYKQNISKITVELTQKNKIIADTQAQLTEKITIIKEYDDKFKVEKEFNSTLKVEIEKLKTEIGVLKEKGDSPSVDIDKPVEGGMDFTDIIAILWMIGNWVLILAGCIIFLFGLSKLWNWLILLWNKFKDKRKVQPVQVVDDQCCEDLTEDFDKFKTQIMNRIDLLSKNIQDSIHDTGIGSHHTPDLEPHPDYREPPSPIVLPKYQPTDEPQLYPRVPSRNVPPQQKVNVETTTPPVTRGYGPVPPKMPAREFTVDQVFEAIDEVSKRHSMDDRLCTVSQLVRQILHEPKRNVTTK